MREEMKGRGGELWVLIAKRAFCLRPVMERLMEARAFFGQGDALQQFENLQMLGIAGLHGSSTASHAGMQPAKACCTMQGFGLPELSRKDVCFSMALMSTTKGHAL